MLIIKFNIIKNESVFFFFLIPLKYFNSPPFINVGRETAFLGKNEIQAQDAVLISKGN